MTTCRIREETCVRCGQQAVRANTTLRGEPVCGLCCARAAKWIVDVLRAASNTDKA
jgi:hypothetical protein